MNITTKVNFEDISQKLSGDFTINVSGEYKVLENISKLLITKKNYRKI